MNTPVNPPEDAQASEFSLPIGDLRWTEVLPMLIAAVESGTPTGIRMAKAHLAQMAATADVAGVAIGALLSADARGAGLDDDVRRALAIAQRTAGQRSH